MKTRLVASLPFGREPILVGGLLLSMAFWACAPESSPSQPMGDPDPPAPIPSAVTMSSPGLTYASVGFVDDVRAPGDPTLEEFLPKMFSDLNGNGLDDGEETQANILEAFFRALQTYPIVDAAFLWDHAIDADAEIEALSHLRSTRVRGKLAEEIIRLVYRGSE